MRDNLVAVGILFLAGLYLLLNPFTLLDVTERTTHTINSTGTYNYNGSIVDLSQIRVNATKDDELILTGRQNSSIVTQDTIQIDKGNYLYTDNLSFERSFKEIEFDANQTGDVNILETEITTQESKNYPYSQYLLPLLLLSLGFVMAVRQ